MAKMDGTKLNDGKPGGRYPVIDERVEVEDNCLTDTRENYKTMWLFVRRVTQRQGKNKVLTRRVKDVVELKADTHEEVLYLLGDFMTDNKAVIVNESEAA